jgi:hypothetical protein
MDQMMKTWGNPSGSGSSGNSTQNFYSQPASAAHGKPDLAYMKQVQSNSQVLKDYEDEQALRRIASSSAAGGNALSGARLGAEQDYLRNSGAAFNSTMGQLMQSALENERNRNNSLDLATIGVGPQYASVRERANEASMDDRYRGMGMAYGAATGQQDRASEELQGQYADWLRQIGMMRDESRYPDELALRTMQTGGYPGQTPNQYGAGTSQAAGWAALLASLFGNGGSNGFGGSTVGSLINAFASLLDGGDQDYGPLPQNSAADQSFLDNGFPVDDGMAGDSNHARWCENSSP